MHPVATLVLPSGAGYRNVVGLPGGINSPLYKVTYWLRLVFRLLVFSACWYVNGCTVLQEQPSRNLLTCYA